MAGKKILIVEDNSIVAMEISHRLKKLGYNVGGTAATGKDAIRLAEETRPDLILMDINLKGDMDGIEAAERISAFLDVPLIYLTAYSDDETLQRAKKTQPYSYLIKPFEERELYSNIEMALYKHKVRSTMEGKGVWIYSLLKSIPHAVIATDLGGKVIFLNSAAENLTGYLNKEAAGRHMHEIISIRQEGQENIFEEPFRGEGGKPAIIGVPMEAFISRSDVGDIPVECTMGLIRDFQNEIEGYVFLFRDLRQRKERERNIRSSEQTFRAVLDATSDPVAVIDRDLRITYYNPAFLRLASGSASFDELSGLSISLVFPSLPPFQEQNLRETMRQGHGHGCEVKMMSSGASLFSLRLRMIPVPGRDGDSESLIILFENP